MLRAVDLVVDNDRHWPSELNAATSVIVCDLAYWRQDSECVKSPEAVRTLQVCACAVVCARRRRYRDNCLWSTDRRYAPLQWCQVECFSLKYILFRRADLRSPLGFQKSWMNANILSRYFVVRSSVLRSSVCISKFAFLLVSSHIVVGSW